MEDLEARLAKAEQALAAVSRERDILRAAIHAMPAAIATVTGPQHVFVLANKGWQEAVGKDEPVGRPVREVLPELESQGFHELLDRVFATGEPFVGERVPVELPGKGTSNTETRYFTFHYIPLRLDGSEEIVGIVSHAIDVSVQVHAEQQSKALLDRLDAAQQELLRELSTPLIPLADGLVVMPLIGQFDRPRAQLVLETLLYGVSHHRARIAILDVTGVRAMDGTVAASLLAAARAASLLGARVILSGIDPNAARSLVDLDADLTGVLTHGTLQSAVAYALSLRKGAL